MTGEGVGPPAGTVVAGIGFRHAARGDDIVALVRRALAVAGLPTGSLRALATAADRAHEPPIRAAASMLGLPVVDLDARALEAAGRGVATRSERIEALRGVGSLAEAAALAAAGTGARLLLPRIADGSATCALALAPETP